MTSETDGEHNHLVLNRHADFIECRCGILSVNRVDRQAHLDDVRRRARLT